RRPGPPLRPYTTLFRSPTTPGNPLGSEGPPRALPLRVASRGEPSLGVSSETQRREFPLCGERRNWRGVWSAPQKMRLISCAVWRSEEHTSELQSRENLV